MIEVVGPRSTATSRSMTWPKSNLLSYETGKIDYVEFMRRDIALWPKNLHISEIDSVLSNFTLNPQASDVISDIEKLGYTVAIVSAGLDLLANKVAHAIDVELVVANGLQTDSEGFLTGEGIFRVDLMRKDIALESILRMNAIAMSHCMTVGDSKYDAMFLKRAAYGVSVSNDPDLAKVASFVVGELKEIIQCIRSIEAKPVAKNS